MGFTTGNLPPVDPETFHERPFFERIRILATQWADYGFGTPKMVHVIYIVKLLTLYVVGGLFVATATSGLGPIWDVATWWPELIVYEKLILWTVLLETLGLAGSWGPLAAHFKPMTGGFRYWARPDTIRLPPWPDKIPFTRGDRRTLGDVALYLAIVATAVAALIAPTVTRTGVSLVNPALLLTLIGLLIVMGLRDKVVFLAARSEQYVPALVFFAVLGPVDLIIALKLLIVAVWIGAGVSKFGRHFSRVVSPMVSNTPWAPRALKRMNYRRFPDDLRPSHAAGLLAHVGGTTVEIVLPLVLLFSTNPHHHAARRDRHGRVPRVHPLDVPDRGAVGVECAVRFRRGVPVLGPPGLGGLQRRRHLLAGPPRRHRRGLALLPGARQPAPRPRVVPAVDAPVRRQLGVGHVGVRARCRGQARQHRARRRQHRRPGRGHLPAPGRRDAAHHADGVAVAAQPRSRAVVDDGQAPRRRHRHVLAPRGRVRLQHGCRVQLR